MRDKMTTFIKVFVKPFLFNFQDWFQAWRYQEASSVIHLERCSYYFCIFKNVAVFVIFLISVKYTALLKIISYFSSFNPCFRLTKPQTSAREEPFPPKISLISKAKGEFNAKKKVEVANKCIYYFQTKSIFEKFRLSCSYGHFTVNEKIEYLSDQLFL